MKKTECLKCGKVIEGYSDRHIEYLLEQHLLKHSRDKRKDQAKKIKEDGKSNISR